MKISEWRRVLSQYPDDYQMIGQHLMLVDERNIFQKHLDASAPNGAEVPTKIAELIKEKGGIRLDIGAGSHPHPGFVTMDRRAMPGIDVVHDLADIPWPLPDACCQLVVMSHVIEHLKPWTFFPIMDELWRVMKPGGQLLIATPYPGTPRWQQDPTHCLNFTERGPHYLDPDCQMSGCTLYDVYRPRPWKIELIEWQSSGDLNVRISKRPLITD
jgi:SAM-dependent methyltransferase